jgi:regulator of protease activity HflC (stomatin/prohibitin superfamily)
MKRDLMKNLPLLLFLIIFIVPLFGRYSIIAIALFIALIFVFRQQKERKFDLNALINSFKKEKTNSSIFNNNKENIVDVDNFKNMKNARSMIITIALIVFGAWLFFASIQIVDAGETGVYSLFGKVRDNELKSGFHLVIPLAKVTRMSIRTEEYTMSIVQGEGQRFGSDVIAALTKEGLSVDLDMTVFYRLQEENASDVYRELGDNYDEKIIRPTIRTAIRDVIAQFEAKDIYSEKRDEVATKIKELLAEELDARGITIETVLLRNVNLPANLANAIQEKLQAEQEAEKYDFVLDKEKKEKERKVIEAEGRRDSQKIINESLSTNYLYFLYINELKDREGTIYVPTSPDTGMPLFRELGR